MPRQQLDNSSPAMNSCEDVQMARAKLLLDMARAEEKRPLQFTLEVAALHLARAIPDYWYTTAGLVASALNLSGND